VDVDVEQRDVVLASGSLAGSDQLATVVASADGEDLHFSPTMVPRHGKLASSSKAASKPISCSSSSWLSTIISSIKLLSSGSAWRLGSSVSLSGGWVESVRDKWWAADLAAVEPADRAVHAHGRCVPVVLDDDAVDAL
jgi:hypothetical protein